MEPVIVMTYGVVTACLAVACTAITLYKLFKHLVIYVPPNHVIVVVDSNGEKQVKQHGYRVVKWPFERVIETHWSHHVEDEQGQMKLVHYNSSFVPTHVISMDTPSFSVTDRFGVSVDVDVIFRFVINDPILAVSINDDLYRFLEDCVETGTYNVINNMDYKDTIGQNAFIAEQMKSAIDSHIKSCGCTVVMLVVENIEPDKNLGETVQQQSVDAQKAHIKENQLLQERRLAERQREDAEFLAQMDHENQLLAIERQLVLAQKAIELAQISKQETSISQDVAERTAELEQARRIRYITELKALQFSNSDIIQIVNSVEIAKQMAQSFGQNTKFIMSPGDYSRLFALSVNPFATNQQE